MKKFQIEIAIDINIVNYNKILYKMNNEQLLN